MSTSIAETENKKVPEYSTIADTSTTTNIGNKSRKSSKIALENKMSEVLETPIIKLDIHLLNGCNSLDEVNILFTRLSIFDMLYL